MPSRPCWRPATGLLPLHPDAGGSGCRGLESLGGSQFCAWRLVLCNPPKFRHWVVALPEPPRLGTLRAKCPFARRTFGWNTLSVVGTQGVLTTGSPCLSTASWEPYSARGSFVEYRKDHVGHGLRESDQALVARLTAAESKAAATFLGCHEGGRSGRSCRWSSTGLCLQFARTGLDSPRAWNPKGLAANRAPSPNPPTKPCRSLILVGSVQLSPWPMLQTLL